MQLCLQAHAVTMRFPDLLERQHRPAKVLGGDIAAVDCPFGEVEGPDLHRLNAHFEQFRRELVGTCHEATKIIEHLALRYLAVQAEIARPDIGRLGHVVGSSTGVVNADAVPSRTAEQGVKRLPRGLALDIPQRHVHRGIGPHLGASAREADIGAHLPVQRLDPAGILAQQRRRNAIVDVGFDGRAAKPALAKPDEAVVGVDANPDQGGARP